MTLDTLPAHTHTPLLIPPAGTTKWQRCVVGAALPWWHRCDAAAVPAVLAASQPGTDAATGGGAGHFHCGDGIQGTFSSQRAAVGRGEGRWRSLKEGQLSSGWLPAIKMNCVKRQQNVHIVFSQNLQALCQMCLRARKACMVLSFPKQRACARDR